MTTRLSIIPCPIGRYNRAMFFFNLRLRGVSYFSFWVTVDREHAQRACGEATRNEGAVRDKEKISLHLISPHFLPLICIILLFRPPRVVLRKEWQPLAVCVFWNFWSHAYLSLEGTRISRPQLLQRWTTDQWQAPWRKREFRSGTTSGNME